MNILKFFKTSFILVSFVFVFLLIPSNVEAVATTRTVCPDPVGDCSPSDPSFKGAAGIILAITASVDGDTVSIKNGTYSGFAINQQGDYNYFIVLTKNLTITGESTSGTILSGAGANKASMFLVNNTGNSTISNLSITGSQVITCPATPCSYGSGIEVSATGSGTLSLTNLNLYSNEDTGIWTRGSSNVSISNNLFYANKYGVYFQGSSHVTLANSTVRNNLADAVSVDDSSVAVVNNNKIYSNTNVGLRLWTTSQTTGNGNTIYSNLYTGHASGVFCSESAVLGTWTNNNVWNNANGNYGSDPVGLCTDKTGTNGNISVDPQSLLSSSTSSSSMSFLPETALGEDSFLKIFISFLSICIGIIFLSRHFATISKEDS